MGSFQIGAKNTGTSIRFTDTTVPAKTAVSDREGAPAKPARDQLNLTQKPAPDAPKAALDLFATETKPAAEAFMDRISTRQSSVGLGSESFKVEMGLESEAPQILTSAHEPNLAESLQARLQQPVTAASGEQIVRTGARIQAHESVQLQVGMASAIDPGKLVNRTEAEGSGEGFRPGMYASAAVQASGFSTRVAVDTVHGKPRTELGAAIHAGDSATVGLSFQHHAYNHERGLRLGTEIKATQDTVFGVNLNQPLDNRDTRQTAVGLYLNSRFW